MCVTTGMLDLEPPPEKFGYGPAFFHVVIFHDRLIEVSHAHIASYHGAYWDGTYDKQQHSNYCMAYYETKIMCLAIAIWP